jgi:hypothetical protein
MSRGNLIYDTLLQLFFSGVQYLVMHIAYLFKNEYDLNKNQFAHHWWAPLLHCFFNQPARLIQDGF